ncbi:aquaporin rerated protein [Exophiala viscosa]|uniref:Aquaporin rerated protein n=2 Tax=Exophiala viscosa TaxID=2486360 RepID=A0AAN6DPE1_9EURO|nr:aquaporin rerated protein [Exophiala viscosa]
MGILPDRHRNHTVAFLSELAGTFLFLFFALSIVQVVHTPPPTGGSGSPPDVLGIYLISVGFGTSVAVNVWLFYRVSGGMFNPAVTFTLFLIGAVPAGRAVVVIAAQIIGAIAASAVVSGLFPGPMVVNCRLGGDTSIARGLFIEMFCTTQLVFTVIMLAAVKHKATYLAPLGIGLALFIGNMCSVYYSGAGINPARAFGPDVVNHSFPGYHWIYWVGPLLGSLLAAFFYYLLEAFDWRSANPGQDFDDLETQMITPEKKTDRPNVAHGALHGNLPGANAEKERGTGVPSLEGLNGLRPSKSTQDTQPE